MQFVLDTDTLSRIMRKDPVVLFHATEYLKLHGSFVFTDFTRYEILRGLLKVGAEKQIRNFELLCSESRILPFSIPAVRRAANIWATLSQTGLNTGELDLLIAAIALEAGMGVATINVKHFEKIPELSFADWSKPAKLHD